MPRWMHGLVCRPWAPPQQCYHQYLQWRWPYHLLPLSFYGWVWTLMLLCILMLLDSCVLVGLWPGSRQMVVESFAALRPLHPLMFQVVNRLCHPYLCRCLRLHWLQRKKFSLASFTCFCWWCMHSLPWSSVLGGFLLHHRPFPICRLACCDLLFVGLALVATLDTDWRSLFPCLYRR